MGPWCSKILNEKKSVAELGHSDLFTINVDTNKIYIGPNI